MSLLSRIHAALRSSSTGLHGGGFPPFPDDRPSIYGALEAHREAASDCLPLPALELPDEARYEANDEPGGLRFAPGAFDGAFGHHAGPCDDDETVQTLLAAITRVCRAPTQEHALALHAAVPRRSVMAAIDPLLAEIEAIGADSLDLAAFEAAARWLVTKSPDREAVKLGVALLGMVAGDDDLELLFTVGGHDEFTLYAAVAVANRFETAAADRALWQMARMTEGWGRIQAVERMSDEPAPEIAAWLLREGYANWVMYEYLAQPCATKGKLRDALKAAEPDATLLVGAGEILGALTSGGPGPWMIDYEDGAEATALYLTRQSTRPPDDIRRLLSLRQIRDFVADAKHDWGDLEAMGWTQETRTSLTEVAERSIRDPRWESIVRRGLEADDQISFGVAAEAAAVLGIDVWERRFERQQEGRGDQWWWLMRTDDRSRAERTIALAQDQIDLAAVATGPAMELGLGPDFAADSAVGMILQDLGRFPGSGTPLLLAGLKSSVVRTRNMALKALGEWPRERWPPETAPALAEAYGIEPDPAMRERMAALRDERPPDA